MKVAQFKILLLIFTLALPTVSIADTDEPETIGIIAFGDSLTEGCGVEKAYLHPDIPGCILVCPPGNECYNYVIKLNGLLSDDRLIKYNGLKYVVENFGVGGNKTYDGLERMNGVLNHPCNKEAKFILINFGTNDLGHNRHPQNIAHNLKQMALNALNHHEGAVIPLVATITPDETIGNTKDIVWTNELIRKEIGGLIRAGHTVSLVELYTPLLKRWGDTYTTPRSCYEKFNKQDQLHPNETGCEAIAQLWYQSLIERIHPSLQPIPIYPTWNSLLLEDKK